MFQGRLKTGEGRMVLFILALLLGFLALDGSAQASPILYGSVFEQGFSVITGALKIDGTVNYAVFTSTEFNTLASDETFVKGASSPDFDPNAGYVYLFQPTNNGANSQAILNFSTGMGTNAPVTSWGYIPATVFIEGDSQAPVSASNDLVYGETLDGLRDPLGTLIDPSTVSLTSTSVWVTWNGGIVDGGSSSIIFYTSPYGPAMLSSQINGGGVGASGPTPGASVPEPSTILLMTLGLAGLAGFRRGFHKKEGER